MSTLKKQQHYVWKFYLRPWTLENKIYCLRENKSFRTSLDNIGQKRFFYKTNELGPEEMRFFQVLIKNMVPNVSKSMSFVFNLYNDIANSKNDYQIKCGIENLHTVVENIGQKYLQKLYEEDIDFFESDYDKERFSMFLGTQYTRTNKMREKMHSLKLSNKNLDLQKLSRLTPFIIGEIIARWIYDFSKISLLINETDLSFISSDQPVFNMLADPESIEDPKEMELFYPISPRLAIHLSKEKNGKFKVDKKEVIFYNNLIIDHSYEQLYARDINDLPKDK